MFFMRILIIRSSRSDILYVSFILLVIVRVYDCYLCTFNFKILCHSKCSCVFSLYKTIFESFCKLLNIRLLINSTTAFFIFWIYLPLCVVQVCNLLSCIVYTVGKGLIRYFNFVKNTFRVVPKNLCFYLNKIFSHLFTSRILSIFLGLSLFVSSS